MITFFKRFIDSAKEFNNLRSIVTAALLVALHTVLACFLSVMVTESLRISISFIANVVVGCMFGPVMGLVCGGLGDLIQYVIKPSGPYFFGWTISAALAGLLYGMFFYKKFPLTNRFKEKAEEDNALIHAGVGNIQSCVTSIALMIASIVAWFMLPYVTVMDVKAGTVQVQGSAFQVLKNTLKGHGSTNVAIVSGIMLFLCVAMIVLEVFNLHAISLVISILCCFASVLAIYTDKKTTTALWGFWCFVALIIIYMGLQLFLLAKKHRIDISFFIRCTLVMTIETLLINVLLGTYWVSVMYGKGFAFYFTARLIKNLIQLPINIILTYYVLGFIKNIKKRLY
jgi:ECF transporter S component (folate family)